MRCYEFRSAIGGRGKRQGTVVIASHVRTPGPGDRAVAYARERFVWVLQIDHPLIHSRRARSYWYLYKNSVLVSKGSVSTSVPETVRYIVDIVLTVWWVWRKLRSSDVFIGLGVLNGAAGLLLRLICLTRSSICWVIDYSPRRFDCKLLNRLFHATELVVAWRSDETWNISEGVFDAHRKSGMASCLVKARNIQRIVPIGIEKVADIKSVRDEDLIVFIGHVLEKQGVQLVIDAMPAILAERPGTRFVIMGDGPYLDTLRRRVLDLRLDHAVEFRGFVQSDDEVWETLVASSVAVAPYLKIPDSFTYFADPGKLKQYLGAGLPVCVTSVPAIAQDITDRGCGLVVEDTVDGVRDGILDLFDQRLMAKRRRACLDYANEFLWASIFDDAFSVILHG